MFKKGDIVYVFVGFHIENCEVVLVYGGDDCTKLSNGWTYNNKMLFKTPKEALIYELKDAELSGELKFVQMVKKTKDYKKYIMIPERIKKLSLQ